MRVRARAVPLVTLVTILLLGVAACGGTAKPTTPGGGGTSVRSVPTGVPGLHIYPVRLPRAAVHLSGETESAADNAPKSARSDLSRQIAKAPANAVIHLASGYYPRITDTTERTTPVTVSGAGDTTKPIIHGARLLGASNVRFVDVAFSRSFVVNHTLIPPSRRISRDIQLVDSEIDCGARATQGPGGVGIVIRGGSRNVSLRGDYVHDCVIGLASESQDAVSVGVSITHCLFENFFGDAIDLGGMRDLTITDNVIRDIAHTPGATYHDDGIQFLGNTADVVIARNVLANSRDQLLFIQDAVQGRFSHTSTNTDISVIGNLIYGAGAVAVQDQGGVNVAFVGNTIWAGLLGSMLIRKSGFTGIVPNRTLVADNIIQRYALLTVPGGVTEGYNVFSGRPRHHRGPHDVHPRSAGLTGPRAGLFGITRTSPAHNSAAPLRVLLAMASRSGANAAMVNLLRTYRVHDRGAVAYGAKEPNYGAPFTLTHQKLR